MKKLVIIAALLVFASPVKAEINKGLVKELNMDWKVYDRWKRAIERTEERVGRDLTKEEQKEIYNIVVKVLAKAEEDPNNKPDQKQFILKPYTIDKPDADGRKPHLGRSYRGFWMLMAHDKDTGPKWIFARDGKLRTFTGSYIDLTDTPYDGPVFKAINVPGGPEPQVVQPAAVNGVNAMPIGGGRNQNDVVYSPTYNPSFSFGSPNIPDYNNGGGCGSGNGPNFFSFNVGGTGRKHNPLKFNPKINITNTVTNDIANTNSNKNLNDNKSSNNNTNPNSNTNIGGNRNVNGNGSQNGLYQKPIVGGWQSPKHQGNFKFPHSK